MGRPTETLSEVLDLVLTRALDGSRPGHRSDGARLALAIEGGGMAGAVSAGMCVALEAWGLVGGFDVIYGSSAGALNASYTALGQARQRVNLYPQVSRRGLVDPRGALAGHPAFRADVIFGSLLDEHPHAFEAIGRSPDLRITAVRLEDKGVELLGDFVALEQLRAAVRASCSIPGITGDAVEFRGHRYVDGGLAESLPYRAALREGATHVLVLRSRHAEFRQPPFRGVRKLLGERLLRDAPASVWEMCRAMPARYNTEAKALLAPGSAGLSGRVAQIAPPASAPIARMCEPRLSRVLASIALGAKAAEIAMAATAIAALQRHLTRHRPTDRPPAALA